VDIARSRAKVASTIESLLCGRLLIPKIRIVNRHQQLHHFLKKNGARLGKTSCYPLPPPTWFPKPTSVPMSILILSPID